MSYLYFAGEKLYPSLVLILRSNSVFDAVVIKWFFDAFYSEFWFWHGEWLLRALRGG
jgi:hypothetical protein